MKLVSLLLFSLIPLQAIAAVASPDIEWNQKNTTADLKNISLNFNPKKLITLKGYISDKTAEEFFLSFNQVATEPGPLTVMIDSDGGEVRAGNNILEILNKYKQNLGKTLCVNAGKASSMAFNIMSHCELRLGVSTSQSLFHELSYNNSIVNVRLTAKVLQQITQQLILFETEYATLNSKLMNLSPADYSKFANAERVWSAAELLKQGYLHGILR